MQTLMLALRAALPAVAWFVAVAAACEVGAVEDSWKTAGPGVLRSDGYPASYALVDGQRAIVFGAARRANADRLLEQVKGIDFCLLTHAHRDSSASAAKLLAKGTAVRASSAAAAWLTVDGVRQFWDAAMPRPTPGREPPLRERTFQNWDYLVHPVGLAGVDCSLEDGQTIEWGNWQIQVVATPGHSRDHLAFAARRKMANGRLSPPIVFCGDAIARGGKIWSPYTTDWDHWTDTGLTAARESLRRLAALDATALYPEHGEPITEKVNRALADTADALAEAAFLKSYERYTKERLGSPPAVKLLAPDQVATAGEKPWTRLSEHLYLSGNTYVLASRDGPLLMIDPFGPQIVEQLDKLRADQKLGPLEVAMVSHAHNDHYKGLYLLPDRDRFEVWTLDRVAAPMTAPYRFRAPYLDARSVRVDRQLTDGEQVAWHEYRLDIVHLPGQTVFTMGIVFTVDGKKCFHTADNFYHADQFSGSGGWSGANRGWPLPFAASAREVQRRGPDWVLIEHGGPIEFVAEDFRRRAAWLEAAAKAADALSPSGNHRVDWDLQRIRVEPLLTSARAGQTAKAKLVVSNPSAAGRELKVELDGCGIIENSTFDVSVAAKATFEHELQLSIAEIITPGRHVFPLVVTEDDVEDAADTFFVLDVSP